MLAAPCPAAPRAWVKRFFDSRISTADGGTMLEKCNPVRADQVSDIG